MKVRRSVGSLVATALLVGVGLVVAPSTAMAASCQGSTCEGKDPQTYGCSGDATTKASFVDGQYFEMRYSKKCNAVWTRVDSSSDYNGLFMQIRSYDLANKKRKKVYGAQVLKGTHWTKMVEFTGQWAKTCDAIWFDADPDTCTAYT